MLLEAPEGSKRLLEALGKAPGRSRSLQEGWDQAGPKCRKRRKRRNSKPKTQKRCSWRLQEAPEGSLRLQEAPGGFRRLQGTPGVLRRLQEAPGGSWRPARTSKCSCSPSRTLPRRLPMKVPGSSPEAPGSKKTKTALELLFSQTNVT